jgi:AsmA protein
MRIARIIAIVAGVLIALVIVGVVALFLFVDPNRYRGEIERVAAQHTGRNLTIRGKLELKVFPWLAVSVNEVELSNPPQFGSRPFARIRKASIGVKLLPLLGRRIEVSRIALQGADVSLVSRGAADNNWKDLSESRQSPQASAPPGSAAPSLSIEGVDLSKSSLLYRDEAKKTTTELANLELHTGRLQSGSGRTRLAKVELGGTWLAKANSVSTGAAEPKPVVFSLRTPEVSVDTAAQTLAPAKVELRLADAAFDLSIAGEKLSSDRVVSGSVTLPATSPRELMQSLGIVPPVTRDSRTLASLSLQTNFRLTPKQLQLTALQLSLDDTHVRGTAGVSDLETDAIIFDLDVDRINLDRYRAPPTQSDPARRAASAVAKTAPTPLPLDTLRKLDAHGTLRVGNATFAGLAFSNVVIPLAAKDGRVRLGPTGAQLYGGAYNGDIVLDARPVQAQLSLNEHLHGTDVGALMKAAYDSGRLLGRADANVAVAAVGNTDEALLHSLSGKFDANVKQGALNGIDITYELQRVNALLKKQIPPERTGPARTAFNALQGNGTIDKGVLRLDDLRMETDLLRIRGKGTLDTSTEAIDYQLVASVDKLPGNRGAAAGGLDALGAVEVPLTVTGSLSNPTVRPDIEALAKGKLGQEVQKKASELVKKQLGDKLKDLFSH